MRRATLSLILLAITFFATGCPRYDTVRKFSTEQLKVQEEFQVVLTKYFASMEEYASNEVVANGLYYDRLLKGGDSSERIVKRQAARDIQKIKADATLSTDDKLAAVAARSQELGTLLETMRAENEKDKADLAATLEAYKNKHKEILAAYQAILDAQNQLNEYIQLKKFDEVIVEKLLGTVHANQTKVLGLFDQAATLADKLKLKPKPEVADAASGH